MLLLILPMVEIFACLTAFTEQLPASTVPEPFQVLPYVQNPSQDGFWRHVAGEFGSIASQRPIFPAIGNHENYGGPGAFGGYSAEAADFGVKKLLTYFDLPHNQASNPQHVGRYYRIDYGPMTLIIARLLEPSSELFIAEQWYAKTALPDLLGISNGQRSKPLVTGRR